MSGKTKEMASRYLGNTETPNVSQISRKPNIQSLSTTGDERAYHSVSGLTDRDRGMQSGRAVLGEGSGDFDSHVLIPVLFSNNKKPLHFIISFLLPNRIRNLIHGDLVLEMFNTTHPYYKAIVSETELCNKSE